MVFSSTDIYMYDNILMIRIVGINYLVWVISSFFSLQRGWPRNGCVAVACRGTHGQVKKHTLLMC